MIPFATDIQVNRGSPLQFVDGIQQPTTWTPLTISGSIQPLSFKDIKLLPEGRADVGRMVLFTESTLMLPTEGSEYPADMVIHQGALWEVVSVESWQVLIPHNKYMLERRGPYVE